MKKLLFGVIAAMVLAGSLALASGMDCLDLYRAVQNAANLVQTDTDLINAYVAQQKAAIAAGDFNGANAIGWQISSEQARLDADQSMLASLIQAYNNAGCGL